MPELWRIFTLKLFSEDALSKKINIQGHRGARGHYPENTLRGFKAAVDFGADFIELDVVISADSKVVVSHEPWMNDEICSMRDGSPVPPGRGREHNIYRMPYEVIRKFDCGKRGHPRFPSQRGEPAYKPLLGEVISTIEAYTREKGYAPVGYNIEIKTEQDGVFNPAPLVFVDLVHREIKNYGLGDRLNIQSFDVRILSEMHKKDPSIRLGLLVENRDSMETNLQALGFLPYAYNPEFVLVNEILVKQVHGRGMKIFVWTVNEKNDIAAMLALGVDGIISDYPDRVIEMIRNNHP